MFFFIFISFFDMQRCFCFDKQIFFTVYFLGGRGGERWHYWRETIFIKYFLTIVHFNDHWFFDYSFFASFVSYFGLEMIFFQVLSAGDCAYPIQ